MRKSWYFDYDYVSNTFQHIIGKEYLTQDDISIGNELNDINGAKSPFHYSQWKENKKFFIFEDNYKLKIKLRNLLYVYG